MLTSASIQVCVGWVKRIVGSGSMSDPIDIRSNKSHLPYLLLFYASFTLSIRFMINDFRAAQLAHQPLQPADEENEEQIDENGEAEGEGEIGEAIGLSYGNLR